MIARLWSARTSAEKAPEYRAHLERYVLPALRSLDGYAGATLLTRTTSSGVDIIVITRWRSFEAVRAFAGTDIEQAVVAEDAVPLLTAWDRRVRHYEIVVSDEGGGPAWSSH